MRETFLKERFPAPFKELAQGFVGEDIILPQIMHLRRETGDGREMPCTPKNLLKGYGSSDL